MKSLEELKTLRDNMAKEMGIRKDDNSITRVVVGMATCGIAAGARPVLQEFTKEVAKRKLQHIAVSQTGCIGICKLEPVVEVTLPGQEKVTYVKMTTEKVAKIVNDHIVNGNVVIEYTIGANS